jgi:hypothetical protein
MKRYRESRKRVDTDAMGMLEEREKNGEQFVMG